MNACTYRAVIKFAAKLSGFARSITTEGLENYMNFGKNEKLGSNSKEPEEKEEEENSTMARLRLQTQEVRPRIDLLGASPSEMDWPANRENRYY